MPELELDATLLIAIKLRMTHVVEEAHVIGLGRLPWLSRLRATAGLWLTSRLWTSIVVMREMRKVCRSLGEGNIFNLMIGFDLFVFFVCLSCFFT